MLIIVIDVTYYLNKHHILKHFFTWQIRTYTISYISWKMLFLPKKEHEKELRRNIYFRENNGIVQQEKRQPDNESDMPYLPNKLPN